jgi:hypothetical protein
MTSKVLSALDTTALFAPRARNQLRFGPEVSFDFVELVRAGGDDGDACQ